VSLVDLAEKVLHINDLQTEIHSSVDDAQATMQLYLCRKGAIDELQTQEHSSVRDAQAIHELYLRLSTEIDGTQRRPTSTSNATPSISGAVSSSASRVTVPSAFSVATTGAEFASGVPSAMSLATPDTQTTGASSELRFRTSKLMASTREHSRRKCVRPP
jgi:hypothetical protein